MTDLDREERIRVRAHQLWEKNGRQVGTAEQDWEQAMLEVDLKDQAGQVGGAGTNAAGFAAGVGSDATDVIGHQ